MEKKDSSQEDGGGSRNDTKDEVMPLVGLWLAEKGNLDNMPLSPSNHPLDPGTGVVDSGGPARLWEEAMRSGVIGRGRPVR